MRIADCGLKGLAAVSVLLTCVLAQGCAGAMKKDQATRLIATQLSIPVDQVQINSISSMGSNVVADTTLKVSFALQKNQQGEWQIYRVRTSYGWEPPDGFRRQLAPTALARSLSLAFLAELNSP